MVLSMGERVVSKVSGCEYFPQYFLQFSKKENSVTLGLHETTPNLLLQMQYFTFDRCVNHRSCGQWWQKMEMI